MYPAVREALPDLEDDVLESYEEHHVADVLCMEFAAMSPGDAHFTAKVTVLIEIVEHHVEEQEDDCFPKVRDGLGSQTTAADWRRHGVVASQGAEPPGTAERFGEGREGCRVLIAAPAAAGPVAGQLPKPGAANF
jgi:hypothetical protein